MVVVGVRVGGNVSWRHILCFEHQNTTSDMLTCGSADESHTRGDSEHVRESYVQSSRSHCHPFSYLQIRE